MKGQISAPQLGFLEQFTKHIRNRYYWGFCVAQLLVLLGALIHADATAKGYPLGSLIGLMIAAFGIIISLNFFIIELDKNEKKQR